jgi:uncharacterized protein (TIGR02453 family)
MAIKTKAAPSSAFPGFNEEAFVFLKKLAKNNQRDWFLPRKALFEEHLQVPMTQLMLALEGEMKKNKLPLLTNPKAVLSRIYRDIRFSADKSPYHTFVSGALYRDGKKTAPGVLYVHMGEKEHFAAAGFWQPERPVLTNWRLKMQAEPKTFLSMIKQLKSKKLEISGTHRLQRIPRGFEAQEGSPIGEFLRLQSFVIMRPVAKDETVSADLPRLIARFALDAKPLLEYGWAVPETKPAIFLDE